LSARENRKVEREKDKRNLRKLECT